MPAAARRLTSGLLLVGLLGISLGAYGLLDTSVPGVVGLPSLLVGVLGAVAGLALGSRRAIRTRYRAEHMDPRSAAVAASGLAAAVCLVVTSLTDLAVAFPSTYPVAVPQLALLPVMGLVSALIPAIAAPAPIPAAAVATRREPVGAASR